MENMNVNKKRIEKILRSHYINFIEVFGDCDCVEAEEWTKEKRREIETAAATRNKILSEEEIKNIILGEEKSRVSPMQKTLNKFREQN